MIARRVRLGAVILFVMERVLCAALATLVFAGCGSGLGIPLDGSAAAADDLAVADGSALTDLAAMSSVDLMMARPYDLAWNACVGTAVAGTCAEQFFEPFVQCFVFAGACRTWFSNSSAGTCFENGAQVLMGTLTHASHPTSYWMGNTLCLRTYSYFDHVSPPVTLRQKQFCLPSDASCGLQYADGSADELWATPRGGALYDVSTGIFTCPDGTQVDLGANLGGCEVLNDLLSVAPFSNALGAACSAFSGPFCSPPQP